MTSTEIFGYIAAFCTAFSFVPQVYKIIKTRNTDGISTLMYVVFVTGLIFWLIYGVITNAMPIVIANAFTLALSGTVLVLKLINSRKGV